MNSVKVSIIIPTYNRAHIIAETLDSIFTQTYQNWECIVVDDGSTDHTEAIINKYLSKDNRFKFYYRPDNHLKGANACRNLGLEKSKGEYVMFLDSDDICESFCLEERASIVVDDLSIDLLVRDTAYFIENVKQSFSINKDPEIKNSGDYLSMFLSYRIPWPIMACFYKKSSITNCKFDENLKRFQDLSFNIKVLSQSKEIKIYRDFKIDNYYRQDDEKVLKNNFIGNMLEALIVFNNIHLHLISNVNHKEDLRKFNCKIILEFVMPYFEENKKESNAIFKWYLKSKLYSFKQKRFLFSLMFFLNSKLFKIKGIGMNAFRNHLKKVINN
jgi:glycosyltransferase involved in cell wall biosynthesis